MSNSCRTYIALCAMTFFIHLSVLCQPFRNYSEAQLDSLIDISYDLIWDHSDRSFDIVNDALIQANNLGYEGAKARSWVVLGILFERSDSLSRALEYFRLANNQNHYLREGKINNGILFYHVANIHEKLGNVEEAEAFHIFSAEYFEQAKKYENLIALYNGFGVFYGKRGMYNKALEKFQHSLEASYQLDTAEFMNRQNLASTLNNIAMTYNLMGRYSQAKDFAKQSLVVSGSDFRHIPDAYNTLARIHTQVKDMDSALYYYKLAYKLAIEHQQLETIVELAKNISEHFYDHYQMYDSAGFYLHEAMLIAKQQDNPFQLSELYYNKGAFYYRRNDFTKAEGYALSALPVMLSSKNYYYLSRTYQLLSEIKEAQQKPEEAFTYYKLHNAYLDTIQLASNEREFANHRVRIETLREQQKLNQLNQEMREQRLQFLIVLTISVAVIIVFFVLFLLIRAQNRKKSIALDLSNYKMQSVEEKLKIREEELADHTLHMIRKNRFVEEIEEIARNGVSNGSDQVSRRLLRAISINKSSENEWEQFSKYFGHVHQNFFDKLMTDYPKLSKGDLRHCALIKMNLSMKESADIMGVDPGTIKVARHRLKKKMELTEKCNLKEHIHQKFAQAS